MWAAGGELEAPSTQDCRLLCAAECCCPRSERSRQYASGLGLPISLLGLLITTHPHVVLHQHTHMLCCLYQRRWGINYYSYPCVSGLFNLGASKDKEPVSDNSFRVYPQV